MLHALPKAAFSVLAGSRSLKKLASRYGMRRSNSFARRFIAGESIEEAIAVGRTIQQSGLHITLDHLGESVATIDAANQATRDYLGIMKSVAEARIDRNISLKLTQLGLEVDRATTVDNLRRILDAARQSDFFVRIDMEGSAYTALTLDIFETLWRIGYTNAGVVIQSYLRRSASDVARMNKLGARVRLVKGAYREPRSLAFQQKAEVDASFVELMRELLEHGAYPAIATHDPEMIAATKQHAAAKGVSKDRFEFQMLYGIRRDLQAQVVREGYPFRVYIPFGREWFPYFMRRLGERPANVSFVVKSIVKEH